MTVTPKSRTSSKYLGRFRARSISVLQFNNFTAERFSRTRHRLRALPTRRPCRTSDALVADPVVLTAIEGSDTTSQPILERGRPRLPSARVNNHQLQESDEACRWPPGRVVAAARRPLTHFQAGPRPETLLYLPRNHRPAPGAGRDRVASAEKRARRVQAGNDPARRGHRLRAADSQSSGDT